MLKGKPTRNPRQPVPVTAYAVTSVLVAWVMSLSIQHALSDIIPAQYRPVGIVIAAMPAIVLIALIAAGFTPATNQRPQPALPAGPRNARQLRPVHPAPPRDQRGSTGEMSMHGNIDGTYLNADNCPTASGPTTGNGQSKSRPRQPIPGREVRYLPDDTELLRVAKTLPNYRNLEHQADTD